MPARKPPRPVTDRAARRSSGRSGRAGTGTAAGRLGGPIVPAVTAHLETAPEAVDAATLTEIFRRFHAAAPEPQGELHHVNPFTLLVAVVLSAQATDRGVNRATGPLFAVADTPETMLALGEDRVRDYVRTIGLFNTKAKNVVALSRILVERHGGAVPASLEALQVPARRRRQDPRASC